MWYVSRKTEIRTINEKFSYDTWAKETHTTRGRRLRDNGPLRDKGSRYQHFRGWWGGTLYYVSGRGGKIQSSGTLLRKSRAQKWKIDARQVKLRQSTGEGDPCEECEYGCSCPVRRVYGTRVPPGRTWPHEICVTLPWSDAGRRRRRRRRRPQKKCNDSGRPKSRYCNNITTRKHNECNESGRHRSGGPWRAFFEKSPETQGSVTTTNLDGGGAVEALGCWLARKSSEQWAPYRVRVAVQMRNDLKMRSRQHCVVMSKLAWWSAGGPRLVGRRHRRTPDDYYYYYYYSSGDRASVTNIPAGVPTLIIILLVPYIRLFEYFINTTTALSSFHHGP